MSHDTRAAALLRCNCSRPLSVGSLLFYSLPGRSHAHAPSCHSCCSSSPPGTPPHSQLRSCSAVFPPGRESRRHGRSHAAPGTTSTAAKSSCSARRASPRNSPAPFPLQTTAARAADDGREIQGDAPRRTRRARSTLRVVGKAGLSNPRACVVGDMTDVSEAEPNNDVGQRRRSNFETTVNGTIKRADGRRLRHVQGEGRAEHRGVLPHHEHRQQAARRPDGERAGRQAAGVEPRLPRDGEAVLDFKRRPTAIITFACRSSRTPPAASTTFTGLR